MIVVTGANGQLGRAIIGHLLNRVPPDRIIATARDTAKAAPLAAKGVTVRAADFASPETLPAAFAGARQVLIVSPDKLGEEGLRLTRAAIEAACQVGARRILYTSHSGTHPGSPFANHHHIEGVLAATGIPFTSLRHGFYAESALHLIGNGLDSGEIRTPEDGPVNWTVRDDLAEADAAILAHEDCLDGITPPLAAPHTLTMADIAAIASNRAGRTIKHVMVKNEAWLEEQQAQGIPAHVAALMLSFFEAACAGEFSETAPTLQTLLGRPPKPFAAVLQGTSKPPAR